MEQKHLPHTHTHTHEAAKLAGQLGHIEDFEAVSQVFKQLSDCSRVRIFWLLCHCEECVMNISALVDMSSPAVSHHLRQLKTSGLIVSRREGKEVYYKASDSEASKLLHSTIEEILAITCPK
jgi:DNA-binding transcriptional ArsR family regulator